MDAPNAWRLEGGCHCGNVRLALDWPEDAGSAIPIRACGCSFCRKHGAAWMSHPDGRFRLRTADAGRAMRCRVGTETAAFHVRAVCGAVPAVTCAMEGTLCAVVNARTLDDAETLPFVQTATDFEGETMAARLARRRRNWTPEADDGA